MFNNRLKHRIKTTTYESSPRVLNDKKNEPKIFGWGLSIGSVFSQNPITTIYLQKSNSVNFSSNVLFKSQRLNRKFSAGKFLPLNSLTNKIHLSEDTLQPLSSKYKWSSIFPKNFGYKIFNRKNSAGLNFKSQPKFHPSSFHPIYFSRFWDQHSYRVSVQSNVN